MGLGSSDFPAEVKSFTSIIFEMSYSRYSITDTSGEGGGFPSRVLEEEKWDDRVVGAIFITAIIFTISIAWLSLHVITGNGRGLSGRDNGGP
jgi:hypothetical protein